MDTHARVAIIGGGAMGTALAYHLGEEGWSDTVLLEKDELTSGSTWHAAGLCTYFIGGYAIDQLHAYGVKFYSRLEELTGHYVSWHDCGSLRIALDQDYFDWFRHVKSVAPQIGYEVELLTPEQIRAEHPHINLDGIVGGALTRGDGHVDPAGVANAMAIGARNFGVTIRRHCRVTGIARERSGEWRVSTTEGDIVAEHVVNASGCYARAVQAMVGGTVPIANMLHHYVVTAPIPELVESESELPVVRDPHASCYLRQEQKAGMIGIYETEGAAESWDGGEPHWESESELFEPDYDRVGTWLERGLARIPIFATVGIKRAVHGAISHTPDSNPLLGPAPGLRNFWMCCGSSIGIAQGAGSGKYLAQWMVHGDSEINMTSVDPRRFGSWATNEYARDKSIQDYGLMYANPLPGEELPAGRRMRTSPLHDTLVARGAVHTEAFGWERPKWFSPDGQAERYSFRRSNVHDIVREECRAVRERVGVMDFTSFSKFEVSGADAEAFLGRVFANRPPRPGRLALAHRLSPEGRIQGESTIARMGEDRFYIVSGAAWEVRDMDAFLAGRREGEAVEIANRTDEIGVLVVAGPKSRATLQALTNADLGNEAFPWLSVREIDLVGATVRALRVNYVGSLGWELHCPVDSLESIYRAIRESGEEHGIADFGAYAVDSLRIEKAYKGIGAELTNEITPVEAELMRFVRGDGYVGQEAVEAACQGSPAIRIAYLELLEADEADIRGGESVFHDGKDVGVTTSGAYAHHSARSLFFAYLPPRLCDPGTEVDVRVLGEPRRARVLAEPVYDPENLELRS